MKRLTNEEVRVDESVDRYLGPLADLEGMKPKLLDLILNGPVLNGVSKDVLRQIIRQLYSALAAYEDTGITAEEITATASIPMFVKVTSAALGTTPDHLRELPHRSQYTCTIRQPSNTFSASSRVRNASLPKSCKTRSMLRNVRRLFLTNLNSGV